MHREMKKNFPGRSRGVLGSCVVNTGPINGGGILINPGDVNIPTAK